MTDTFMNMNSISIWIGTPNNGLGLNTRTQANFLCKKQNVSFVGKGVCWGPQALFTAEQAAAGIVLKEHNMFFFKASFSQYFVFLVNIRQYLSITIWFSL